MASIAESWKQVVTFFSETRSELRKVTFPSRSEVTTTTIVVLVASVVFSVFLWISDIAIIRVYRLIMGALGQ